MLMKIGLASGAENATAAAEIKTARAKRILFISDGDGSDYMRDMLFHGLSKLENVEITDVNRLTHMYKPACGATNQSTLYGRGFTLYGLLEEDPRITRTGIGRRIRRHEFDLIVFGSIQRPCRFLWTVLSTYKPHEIAFIDGEDHTVIYSPLLGCGVYFKRELATTPQDKIPESYKGWLKPISFGIPTEKIAQYESPKTKALAYIDPRKRHTYIYDNEKDYYADYASSLFGITTKKAGWDCLRHYEILANNCIPYFVDLHTCPPDTLTELPKKVLLQINEIILKKGLEFFLTADGFRTWRDYQAQLKNNLTERMTTEAIAYYVLQTCSDPAHKERYSKSKASRIITAALVSFIKLLNPVGERSWLPAAVFRRIRT